MIKNFFSIVIRNISRNKATAFINIAGLATGLAASLLILLWVQNEISYETYNENAENIYRVEEDQFYSGRKYHVTVTPFPSGPVWKEKIPEIKEQVRINRLMRLLFRQGEKAFFESAAVAADSTIFRVFTLNMILGDKETALDDPNSVVLTKSLAEKYFGDEDPLGKAIMIENSVQVKVTGIIDDLPNNSIFSYTAIFPYSLQPALRVRTSNSWGNNSILTFVVLEKGADPDAVNKKLTDVVKEFNPQNTINFLVFPLLDIHLHGQFGFNETKGPITSVYIFSLIGIFVLLIACINFINLTTAKASSRAKEIGIKKATGAGRMNIFSQFILESLFQVFIALVFAIILVGLLLNTFNELSGKHFVLDDLFNTTYITGLIIVGLLAGLISAIYPAIYLSSFKPAAVLKGETVTGGKARLRQSLVVLQFTLSILIATTSVFMFMQLKLLQNKDLGFNKENLIVIPMAQNMRPKYDAIKKELKNESLVKGVTASTSNPVLIGSNSGGARWEGQDPEKTILIGMNAIDYDYVNTMQLQLLSGRDFSVDYPGDFARDTTGNFLVNEEVAKAMNTEDPIGKRFRFMGVNGTIVGLMKNFHFRDPDQPVSPLAFALTGTERLNFIIIRLADDIPAALKTIEKVWRNIVPEYPLEYTFIDQDYDNLFRTQIRFTSLMKYFTILAVIIACLGLYGLSLHSAERRTNEIGIRKVMGAGPAPIIYTMSREFITLVLISIIIAIPLGWAVVKKLLSEFAYRIEIDFLVFLLISAGAILVALLTIGFQAYRATVINPVTALKSE